MSNLGVYSITKAELRGAVDGLELALQLGIRNVALQLDSICATQLLRGTSNKDHQHIYRETNFAVDYLAHIGHSATYGIHFMNSYHATLTN
ncbi:hypothetical protein LINGRAPRIM_LOCUS387 [Linum grandiflorum]